MVDCQMAAQENIDLCAQLTYDFYPFQHSAELGYSNCPSQHYKNGCHRLRSAAMLAYRDQDGNATADVAHLRIDDALALHLTPCSSKLPSRQFGAHAAGGGMPCFGSRETPRRAASFEVSLCGKLRAHFPTVKRCSLSPSTLC